MYLCVVLGLIAMADCVTLQYKHGDIVSKTKMEMDPILITTKLNDIVIISAPNLYSGATYRLYSPNGDIRKLNIPRKLKHEENLTKNIIKSDDKLAKKHYSDSKNDLQKHIINDGYSVNENSFYRIFNENYKDFIGDFEQHMGPNDFAIGPISQEDYGNWVLSIYFKDIDNEWIEMFQVISLEIIETIKLLPEDTALNTGDTLQLSFVYPIPDLTSCELLVPNSTFDRSYDRNRLEEDKCGYTVKNLTDSDSGWWKIRGVGRMVYEGEIFISVR